MNLPEEKIEDFNTRMNDWISSQGILFQLTHNGTGLGMRPSLMAQFFRLLLKLVIVGLVGAFAYGGYFFWKLNGDDFEKNLAKGISHGFGVEKTTVRQFKRQNSKANIYQILAEGNNSTFFDFIEARRVQFEMPLLTGMVGQWDGGTIQIPHLLISLKAGAIDDERASEAWQSLFPSHSGFTFDRVECTRADLVWGYSTPASWGQIIDANLLVTKVTGGWKLLFQGGTFSQGILRDLTIQRLELRLLEKELLVVDHAIMEKDGGLIEWEGRIVKGTASPVFEGSAKIKNLPVKNFFPPVLQDRFEGSISGTMKISGSINLAEGITYDMNVTPGHTGLVVKGDIPALQMLIALDSQNNYRKITFTDGSFHVRIAGDQLAIDDIKLSAQDIRQEHIPYKLTGQLTSRPAENEELKLGQATLSKTNQLGLTAGSVSENVNTATDEDLAGLFLKHQFQSLPRTLRLITELQSIKNNKINIEKIEHPHLTLENRKWIRKPHYISGQLKLDVKSPAFEKLKDLPGLSKSSEGTDLYTLQFDLSDLDTDITSKISVLWEDYLENKKN